MPPEINTTDVQITDPNNAELKIDNPDYVKPVESAAPAAAKEALDLAAPVAETTVRSTGNTQVDAVGQLLSDKGVAGADQIIADYAATGEVSISNQAKLVDALGDTLASMAVTQLTSAADKLKAANTSARTETLNYANTAFNGENPDTTWVQIQEFVKSPESGFTADDRAAMTKMLSKGGLQSRLVIDNIAAVYAKSSNTTIPADILAGDSLASGATFTAISAKEYAAELSELVAKHGYESQKVQQLQQRRLQSRNQGIA